MIALQLLWKDREQLNKIRYSFFSVEPAGSIDSNRSKPLFGSTFEPIFKTLENKKEDFCWGCFSRVWGLLVIYYWYLESECELDGFDGGGCGWEVISMYHDIYSMI